MALQATDVRPAAATKAKILIVEDEGLIARDIETRVRKAGYEVAGVVHSGEAVIGKVSEVGPDLILMDIRLSGNIDGIEAASQVMQRHDLPVIYLTAHTDLETLHRAKVTGPFGYLSKPIAGSSLTTSIEIALYKHRLERELRQQRAWMRTVLNTMSDGVIVVDHLGSIQYLNREAERLTGWSASEWLNKPLSKVFQLSDPLGAMQIDDFLAATILEEEARSLPPRLQLVTAPPEEQFPVEGEISPSTEDHMPRGAVITFRDVTSKQRKEQERRQEEKMQAVGRLAAGVAHDFNNLLTVILGEADVLLESGTNLDQSQCQQLNDIKTAASSAASVTRQLLTFSRNNQTRPECIDLNEIVQSHQDLCRTSLGPNIEFDISLDPNLMPIHGDAGNISQVLINLVVNARDAMPNGGTVRVVTENTQLEQPGDSGPEAESYVTLTVEDTGVGMDSEVADRMFEPFFSTKREAGGTGLGLSIVHNVVNDLGGFISVDTTPGHGSTFRVFLPALHEMSASENEDIRPDQPVPERKATLLVVDDNDAVRRLLVHQLENCGHQVLQAADGPQALAEAATHDGDIDVLVTDVIMPRMDGYRLAELLTERQPSVKTIFVSGFADEVINTTKLAALSGQFLQKPFLHSELTAAVDRAISEVSRSKCAN